tara:strand:+ start:766 stop:1401 length:636 start_codon:yes stop_codon:yes gene_type:complete
MLRIITMRYGDEYDKWYEDNFVYMINKYSNLKYDELYVLDDIDPNFANDKTKMFNKLSLFKKFNDGCINMCFDIDTIIKGDLNKFVTDEFTMCDAKAWQHPDYYSKYGLASDVLTWSDDMSFIYDDFVKNLDYNLENGDEGTDAWFKQYKPKTFDTKLYTSIRCKTNYDDYPIVFFNGHKETMLKKGWWHEYTLPQRDWWDNHKLKNRFQK